MASKVCLVTRPLIVGNPIYLPRSLVTDMPSSALISSLTASHVFLEKKNHRFMEADFLAEGETKSIKTPLNNTSLCLCCFSKKDEVVYKKRDEIMRWLIPSMHMMKRYGDKGSPWWTPRDGWKGSVFSPFYRTLNVELSKQLKITSVIQSGMPRSRRDSQINGHLRRS